MGRKCLWGYTNAFEHLHLDLMQEIINFVCACHAEEDEQTERQAEVTRQQIRCMHFIGEKKKERRNKHG